MIWLALALSASAAELPALDDLRPCATPDLWAAVDPIVDPPRVLGVDLQQRDAFGTPNVQTSEHFAVRWGDRRFVDPADVEALLSYFETAWNVQIEQMGHQAPYRTDEFYFNVYIGDTGDGAPPGAGAGGYYTTDSDGWPMIVIPIDSLERPEGVESTVAHEFYHAVQGATQRYAYDPRRPGAWYWEATATWASQVVYPQDQDHARFLFGYAYFPHYRLDFFDYPDQGVVQEYYQYGAFLFPVHVSDRTGSFEVVRDSWREDLGVDDPVEALRLLLAERGEDFDELWLDHIARNATWDYPNGRLYAYVVEAFKGLPEYNNLIAGEIDNDGTAGWNNASELERTQRYGSNTFRMSLPKDGEYTFEVQVDGAGSGGSPVRFGATLVLEGLSGSPPEYRALVVEGDRATLVADDIGDAVRAWLVVGTWTDARLEANDYETFGYRYRVMYDDLEPEVPLDPESPDGEQARSSCGCATGGAELSWLGLVLGGLLLVRRRGSSRDA